MSFEKYFKIRKDDEQFRGKYMKYKKLKAMISSNFTDSEETKFKSEIEIGIKKLFKYVDNRFSQLQDEIQAKKSNKTRLKNLKDLSEFLKLNIIGYKRILKLHDKKSGFTLFRSFKPDFKKQINVLKKIDKLINKLKKEKDTPVIEKYLISPDCEVFVKMALNSKISSESQMFSKISSTIFLDNTNFELYFSLLHKDPDTPQIKLSWTGSDDPEVVRIDLNLSNHSQGFYIKSKDLTEYLNGRNVYHNTATVNKSVIKESYEKIQRIILEKELRPMIRIFSNDTSYKFDDIDIIMRSNMIAIKECSDREMIENIFPLENWRRPEISFEKYEQIHNEEKVFINQSVLELKGNKNEWLECMLAKNSRRVDDFDEYLHGVFLLNSCVGEMPYWIRIINRETVIDMMQNDSRVMTPIDDKPFAIPVRVEPKVFFANERTFLSWIQFAIFLGGIGTAMLGLGDYRASICGIILIIVASIFSVYSLYLFHWRARKIREKHPGPYDDKYGPFFLVGVFLVAIFLCSIFKFPFKK